MDLQRSSIKGRVLAEDDPQLQDALGQIYETIERPRCLCVPGGVEMYVARHRRFVVKRMPETGNRHAPICASYELEAQQSGLGELLGEAVVEREPGKVGLSSEQVTQADAQQRMVVDQHDTGAVLTGRHRRFDLSGGRPLPTGLVGCRRYEFG